ncbi:MAG: signal peptidase I [Rickettsiales bacterium]|jgi:signal peptidase I|nr:signal peptidase I [Rickettsiales bacterium]
MLDKIKFFLFGDDEEGVREFVKSIVCAFVLAIFIRSFLYEPFHIPSGSMKPGLLEGDYIFVSKFKYGYSRYSLPFGPAIIENRIFNFRKPERGDVIVFKLPRDTKVNYIKRLIGLPGDKIAIRNNILYINGEEIGREYIGEYSDEREYWISLMFRENFLDGRMFNVLQKKIYDSRGDGDFTVPEGYYFFMGDNRDNSVDSRFKETGFVPYKNIIGKANIIFFSKRDSILKFWKWHKSIRFNRIFKIIR